MIDRRLGRSAGATAVDASADVRQVQTTKTAPGGAGVMSPVALGAAGPVNGAIACAASSFPFARLDGKAAAPRP